eukprot:s1645_g13.t1
MASHRLHLWPVALSFVVFSQLQEMYVSNCPSNLPCKSCGVESAGVRCHGENLGLTVRSARCLQHLGVPQTIRVS